MLEMTDVGVRVIEMRDRSRRSNLPTVLGRKVKTKTWPIRHLDFAMAGSETVFVADLANERPTLFLRLATGLLAPDEGTIALTPHSVLLSPPSGKVIKSLSVGQAARLMAGLYGMPDHLIDRRFADIVEFANVTDKVHRATDSVGKAVLQQVAFAAATAASADLYAFDRMALVGDAAFHEKCRTRIGELKAAGRGILVHSQNPQHIRDLGDRGLVIDGPRTRMTDPDTLARLVIDAKKGRLKAKRKKRRRRDAD
ncbi:MAG: hypothetical protein U0R64_01440 [Candidatus Nanopelagicales bacterium]